MAAAYCEDVFNALRMIEKALEIEVEKEAILRPQQEGNSLVVVKIMKCSRLFHHTSISGNLFQTCLL